MKQVFVRNAFSCILIALVVLFIGFSLSSGMVTRALEVISDRTMAGIQVRFLHHISNLEVTAKHYFLVPTGSYLKELLMEPIPLAMLAQILANSVFNILFQPVFISPFTPQVVLNLVAFPFFLYGAVRYFGRTWFLLIIFIMISFQIGIYDSVVEALIRHGMPCELIYLLIGAAGLAGWITKNS
ncbi:MAG: hypothetical protein JXB40_00540 [Candidatus Omnitrophica bacterium]|nr:hypothetical protein [Candidatus Omnitrophota bacterium]